MCECCHDAQGLSTGVENSSETRTAFLILLFAKGPWLVFDNVFVHSRNQCPCRFQRFRKLILLEMRVVFSNSTTGSVSDGIICLFMCSGMRWIGDLSLKVAVDHGQRTAGKIAETVGKIGIVALH